LDRELGDIILKLYLKINFYEVIIHLYYSTFSSQ